MNSVITKSALLLSILTLLPLASASAESKKVPLILMDTGKFTFTSQTTANLKGSGTSTHIGTLVSSGQFRNVGSRPRDCFKGEITGTAIAAPADEDDDTVAASSASSRPTRDTFTYSLSALFCPGEFPGLFYGVGTYRITGGTGKFKRATGFGEFIGLANFGDDEYNCFLKGTISY